MGRAEKALFFVVSHGYFICNASLNDLEPKMLSPSNQIKPIQL